MEFIMERGLELWLIVLAGVGGIVFKLLEREAYKRYLIQTDNIAGSRNKYLKQLKLKYDNAVRMNKHFGNVQAYTKRFYFQFRFVGMRILTLHSMAAFLSWFSAMLGIVFTYLSYCNGYSIKAMVMPCFVSVLMLLVQQMSIALSGCEDKKEELLAKITDYLENVYPKSAVKEMASEGLEEDNPERQDREASAIPQIAVTKERKKKTTEKKKEDKRVLTAEEALILEELLREYRG